MSSNEEDYNDGGSLSTQGLKKRKIQRACDICRRKKIRCDGVQMPRNRCSNCVSYSLDCTYVEASKKRGPPKGYVESLENRVEKLDKLLRKLIPDTALFKELQDSVDNEQVPFNPSPLVATQQQTAQFHTSPASPIDKLALALRSTTNTLMPPDDVDEDSSVLSDHLKRLALSPTPYRFFGKSSGAVLIQAAVELKHEYTQSTEPISNAFMKPAFSASRSEFWTPQHWESKKDQLIPSPQYTFPEAVFGSNLVDLYFSNINLYLPLLHRPTFEKSVAEGLHYRDDLFASTYLLVCAIGSRFSDDPRVLLEGDDSLHSSGWKWFNQVQIVRKSILTPPTLYDLQFYCLSVHFLQGSSAPQSCWTMVGIGIRLAQDVGAHRRKDPQLTPTVEDEQWKRGFWVLVCLDRMLSASLGRPCATNDEDFDLDLPIDCDDEYWDHPDPDQRFKQPENKPSSITAFVRFIQLTQILSYCLRTIYAINKSKILLGYAGQQWEQAIVAELDSALNKWVDSVPDNLRWDPHRENMVFFNQSASLYALYYHLQILIHRPFIPTPNKPLPLVAFPSLAICTNAARSCTHITDIFRRRNPFLPLHCAMAMFTSGIVLLLNIWGGKRSGLSVDPYKEMTDVHKCMKALKVLENKWRSIGRLWDILCELASVGDLPLPEASPMAVNKREWDSDTPKSVASSESPQPVPQDDSPRIIAGSRRVNKDRSGSKRAGHSQHLPNQQQHPSPQQSTSTSSTSHRQLNHNQQHLDHSNSMTSSVSCTPTYTLPVHSDELGRLPLHGHMNFSAQSYLDQTNYWYPNVANSGGAGSEGNTNSDHIVLSGSSRSSSLSHHSNRRQHQEHNLVQSSHNNYPYSTTDTSTVTQTFPLNSTVGTGNVIFDPASLTYMPPASYPSVSPSMNMVSPQNSVGGRGRSLHPSFRDVSMALTSNLGGVVGQGQESSQPPSHLEQPQHQHHHHHAQGQPEHDVHGNHHHHEQQQQQQQQSMGYSYVDNDTMAMWSNAPTGFELDEWGAYLSNMSQLAQGDSGQIQQQQQH